MNVPIFQIGSIPITGRLVLAPMDGYSDSPFRSFTRQMGSAISYSEFINSIDVLNTSPSLEQRISFTAIERPIGFQLLDDNPDRMLRSAEKLYSRGPDFFDINFGCPSKSVVHRGAGSALLKDLKKMSLMIQKLTDSFKIPITAKIRLGWDLTKKNHLEITKMIEANGAACIAVHARTRSQGYSGIADWDAIAEIKQNSHIPIIGNGDVRTVLDIDRMFNHTHCDAIMIGRAAVANPWIFMRMDRSDVPIDILKNSIKKHLSLSMDFYGCERGAMLYRKFAHLVLKPYHLDKEMRVNLFTEKNPEIFLKGILKIIDTMS
jgi:tRNA-dihydrouridine synthase B